MSDENQPLLNPTEIAIQAAALADHLQRSGVQWLPQQNAAAVASLVKRFASPKVEPAVTTSAVRRTGAGTGQPTAQLKPDPASPKILIDLSSEESYPDEDLSAEARQAELTLIDAEVKQCQRCEVLASCRKKTVFGEGSVTPRFAFFGEGPGADEDLSGRPFVGRAGALLTKMIEACTLRRADVYILNTVKCRPPGNRNPEPGEIQNCREFYQRQLTILRPQYIVCLGAISSQELLQNKLPVGKMRGKLHRYFDSKVLVTYHPAYLLRNPAAKKAAWEDLQMLMRDAGIQLR